MAKQITSLDAYRWRKKLKMNQTQFWSRVGVTQSGGSRYESGRPIPAPVKKLLVIAYGTDRQSAAEVDKLRPAKGGAA